MSDGSVAQRASGGGDIIKKINDLTDEGVRELSSLLFGNEDNTKDEILFYLGSIGREDEDYKKVNNFFNSTELSEEEQKWKEFIDRQRRFASNLKRFRLGDGENPKLPEGFIEEFGPHLEKYSNHLRSKTVTYDVAEKKLQIHREAKVTDSSKDVEDSKAVGEAYINMVEVFKNFVEKTTPLTKEYTALLELYNVFDGLRGDSCNQENAIRLAEKANKQLSRSRGARGRG